MLVDQYNYTLGTTTASSAGPSLTGTTTTQSGNTIAATSGIFYQDMFYNWTCTEQGDKYLDEHNGHDHDGIGYHYHLTIDESGTATFPYTAGPQYYGCFPGGGTTNNCISTPTGSADKLSICGTSSAKSYADMQCLTYEFDNVDAAGATSQPTTSSSDSSSTKGSPTTIIIIVVVVVVGGAILAAIVYFACFASVSTYEAAPASVAPHAVVGGGASHSKEVAMVNVHGDKHHDKF